MIVPDLSMPLLRSLLGCDFGTKVKVPGVDDKPCQHKAEHRVQLYDNGQPLEPMKLCPGHFALVETQTTPRAKPDDLEEER